MRTLILADEIAVVDRMKELAPGLEVIRSRDPRRQVVLAAIAAVHGVSGRGWDFKHAADNVSIAIPRVFPTGFIGALAGSIGSALLGSIGELLGKQFDHPVISLSPAAEATSLDTIDTVTHETGHLLEEDEGGIAWCLKYGLSGEHRVLGAEVPCYATTPFWRKVGRGEDPAALADAIVANLAAYGATPALQGDARRMLESHVRTINSGLCPAVRTVIEAVRVLQARGVDGLPSLPPVT